LKANQQGVSSDLNTHTLAKKKTPWP